MAKDTSETEPVTTGTLTPVLFALIWLGSTSYTLHATVTGRGAMVSGPLAAAIAGLPGVVAATLVAGASIGAAAGRRVPSAGRRLGAGLALGVLLGLAAAAGVQFAFGGGLGSGRDAAMVTLAVVVGAAGVVGSTLAVLPGPVLRAGLWGTAWVFLLGVIFGVLQPELVKLLGRASGSGIGIGIGGGRAADTWFVVVLSLVSGLAAALAALRIRPAQPDRGAASVLWRLVGGALPGLLLLGAEGITRAGGSATSQLVHGFPAGSPNLVQLSEPSRLRHALIVLAVGGLIALLVSARQTLRRAPRPGRRAVGGDAFRQRLARIGLSAGERYGFAVAGGYAVQAAGFLKRPSDDIDLFTVWQRRGDFEPGVQAIIDAYHAAGLTVTAERGHDTFVRLTVSDDAQAATVELGLDTRTKEPVRSPIGLVLHPDDAVANKIRAIYERAHACDFIDIDAVLRSRRYDQAALLRLAEQADITFDRRVFAEAIARVQLLDADEFARYGVVGQDLERLRQRFARWRAELLGAADLAR